eukprot:CAMPEP_0176054316 /NCGR_PEP_ID=MMETSP0120_2-20121206/27024_1 /TAXON_ID=160619 /ORGANISM="Kryptoperidinium foliaceum, Strain CCMP 1326" /LENGTH=291 /DNA_ID=CAMNT_0017387781 /DNA_START=67 /DNA_END=943 /DNA_ORIENTATION=-
MPLPVLACEPALDLAPHVARLEAAIREALTRGSAKASDVSPPGTPSTCAGSACGRRSPQPAFLSTGWLVPPVLPSPAADPRGGPIGGALLEAAGAGTELAEARAVAAALCNQKLAPPPGLTCSATAAAALRGVSSAPGLSAASALSVEGPARIGARVEWLIVSTPAKLRASGGCPLLPAVDRRRLRGGAIALRARRTVGCERCDQAAGEGAPAQRLAAAGDRGSVRVKVGGRAESQRPLVFSLAVGDVVQGPFACDFSEREVHECALALDWRRQMDHSTGNLLLRLEFLAE